MPPVHRDTDKRFCGADTLASAIRTFFNFLPGALQGDLDSHGLGGALQQAYGKGNVTVEGKKLIVAMGDKAMPDSIGLLMHPFAPTDPASGSPNVFAYNGAAGGGLGSILGGNLNIGEIVRIGGQIIGTVKNFTNSGGGSGQVVLQNMTGTTPQAGQTLVGDDTGNSFTLSSFEQSYAYEYANTAVDYTPVMDVAITDDYGVIAMPEHFTGKPSQDYQSEKIVIT